MAAPELVQETKIVKQKAIATDDEALHGTILDLYRTAETLYAADQHFLRRKVDGQWVGEDFQTVKRRLLNVSAALVAAGVKAGDRVAIMSRNRPEWAIVDLAVQHAGAASVPIYDTLEPKTTGYILKDSGAKIVFGEDGVILERILEGRSDAKATNVKRVIVFDPPAGKLDKLVTSFADFEQEGASADDKHHDEVTKRSNAVAPDALCSIVYTSGTTGMPKGVMLSHNNFHSNVIASLRLVPYEAGAVGLSFLPLSHVFERMAGYYLNLAAGVTIAYAENVAAVPANLVEVQPDVMASVPRLYEKMHSKILQNVDASSFIKKRIFAWALGVGEAYASLKVEGKEVPAKLEKKFAKADKLVFSKIKAKTGGRLQFFISGGAPLSKTVEVFFASLGIAIYQGYGLTETSPVISVNNPKRRRFGSVGPVVDGVEVKIAEDGEILCRGLNVMQGYWNRPEDTAEAIDKDGWFHTGDIGKFDDDGFLYVTDRKKELIVMSNGKNVAPQPIENDLKTQPHIAQAVVIGDNRNFMTAIIAPDFDALAIYAEDHKIDATDPVALVQNEKIQALLRAEVESTNGRLSRYEQIKKFRLLPRELTHEAGELTPTLKTKRKVIDANYAQLIEEMYAGTKKDS